MIWSWMHFQVPSSRDALGIEPGRPGLQIIGAADARAGRADADESLVKNGIVPRHVVGDEVWMNRAFSARLGAPTLLRAVQEFRSFPTQDCRGAFLSKKTRALEKKRKRNGVLRSVHFVQGTACLILQSRDSVNLY